MYTIKNHHMCRRIAMRIVLQISGSQTLRGTPPISTEAPWISQLQHILCFSQRRPVFDPSQKRRPVMLTAMLHRLQDVDGSESEGFIGVDYLRWFTSDLQRCTIMDNVRIGCGHANHLAVETGIWGILGLGKGGNGISILDQFEPDFGLILSILFANSWCRKTWIDPSPRCTYSRCQQESVQGHLTFLVARTSLGASILIQAHFSLCSSDKHSAVSEMRTEMP
ncbi:hypothetical protein Mapa_000128 [Marchantia paleacea]|nr:hypothetical protein Mapa_000128 [Marchantia paleacea]